MRKILINSIVLFALLLGGCSIPSGCDDVPPSFLKYSLSSISIDLEQSEGYYHAVSDMVEIDDELLYYGLDTRNSTIDIYNLDRGNYLSSITLDSEGPNEIRHFGEISFKVVSRDSIVLLTPYKDFYIIDSKGKILTKKRLSFDKYGFDKPYQHLDFFSMGVSEYVDMPLVLDRKGNVYTALFWSKDAYHSSNFWKEYSLPPFLGIPLHDPDSMFFVGAYPPVENLTEVPRSILNTIAFDEEGSYAIQFDAFHYLNGGSVGLKCARISGENKDVTRYAKSTVITDEEELVTLIEDPSYTAIKYDEYNKVFYRIHKKFQDFENADKKTNRRLSADFSIQVFDQNLEYLGQVDVPGGKYDYLKPHVARGGIVFSKETIANKNDKEDLLEFTMFHIQLP